jgi:hypothetical protein
MSEKKFTPYEVAMAILKKSQEVYNKHADLKKSEDVEKCGETKVVGKAEDLKKIGGASATTGQGGGSLPGSVATTGGPSIASQIGFGKGEDNTTREQRVKEKEKTGKDLSRIGRNFEIRNETSEEASKRKSHEADVKTLVEANKPKVDKKLPDFLKKKFMKKSDGAPKAPTAAVGSPSNSPQSPKAAAGGLPPVKEEK